MQTSAENRGGDFKLCDDKEEYCSCGGCRKHRRNQIAVQNKDLQTIVDNPAADEGLEAFAKGKLEELTHFHGGYHGNP